jgi:hypothetical protein
MRQKIFMCFTVRPELKTFESHWFKVTAAVIVGDGGLPYIRTAQTEIYDAAFKSASSATKYCN